MSLLAIFLPVRGRAPILGPPAAATRLAAAVEPALQWSFVYSRQGQAVDRQGRAAATELPKADRVVLVLQDEDVSWLSATLPPPSAKRLKEALRGALEDQLLEDPASTHLAVWQHGLQQDGPTWVAAIHKPWIEGQLAHLQAQGIQADALVCLSEPGPKLRAHARLGADGQALAVLSGPLGVVQWPLGWPGARAQVQAVQHWTSEPGAAQLLAEHSQAEARLLDPGIRALLAAQAGTNLLQFDLLPQRKGLRAALAAWAAFKDRRYRALHAGLAALVLVQAVGLNVQAWQSQRELQALQLRQAQMLLEAFPEIRVVVDPVLQAERALQALRRAAGEPGPTELETGLDVVASAWAGQPIALSSIAWDERGLTLRAPQWPQDAVQRLQNQADPLGWKTRLEGSVLRLVKPGAAQP